MEIAIPLATSGTTSACAENTWWDKYFKPATWNYLRMRGEYSQLRRLPDTMMELPPHARRIQFGEVFNFFVNGTTSACAENTNSPTPFRQNQRNYLRMRGEYRFWVRKTDGFLELPPHARRIRKDCAKLGVKFGTTSACAENTNGNSGEITSMWNYLRMRGEYSTLPSSSHVIQELPPHARRILRH